MGLRSALTGGAVAGGVLALILFVVAFALLPAGIAAGWYFDHLAFETAAVALLVWIAYLSG